MAEPASTPKPVSGVPAPTATGAIVTGCPGGCANAWKEAEAPTAKIAAEPDPIKRNKMISAAYAEAYQQDPELKWFGTAAFASKQVGCGMQTAKDTRNNPLAYVGTLGGSPAMADATLSALGNGNKAVFQEMMPVQKFYHDHGIEALKACAPERNPPVPQKVVDGFALAAKGKADGSDADMRKGALTMLWQEQNVTLQKSAYDNKLFSQALQKNQSAQEGWMPTFGLTQPTKVVFDAACSSATAPSYEKAGGNLTDPKWRWDFAQATANKFSDLAASQPQQINSALQQIIKAGH